MIWEIRSNVLRLLTVIILSSFLIPAVSAAGYGTSHISLTASAINMSPGGSASVGYNVTLASGGVWGTTLIIANKNQLTSQGISASLSNPGGASTDPPFGGSLMLSASSSIASGIYNVVLQATGDDPSTTNATLTLNFRQASSANNNTSAGSTIASTVATTAATTAGGYGTYGNGNNGYTQPSNGWGLGATIFSLLVAIVAIFFILKFNHISIRLIVAGIGLILIGTSVWLYGDYGGGATYAWGGAFGVIVGTLVWIVGDYIGGAFDARVAKLMNFGK